MKPQLIRTDGIFPPGGYPFIDHVTGKQYKETGATFNVRVKEIIRDRLANQRLFTDPKKVDPIHVSLELSEYVCARLKGNSQFCTDGTLNQPQPVIQQKLDAIANRKCPNCGSLNLKATVCPTCAKIRVTGYECKDCGQKISV